MSKGGEQPTVPKADFTSYYGKPILNPPVWKTPDVPGYLFLGGMAGAASVLGAGAHVTGRRHLARRTKVAAVAAVGLGATALVHDLGRPERFVNMLRVFKVTSPLSVGSWLLAVYGPAAGLAAASDLTGVAPIVGTAATLAAATLGPMVTTYTAALLCDTAVPAWHEGYREMPFVFAGSAAAAAGGLGLMATPLGESGPARRLAILGGLLETAATKQLERREGMVGTVYRTGPGRRYLRASEVLGMAGIAGAVVTRRSRWGAMLSGAAMIAASACTRWGIFHGGLESARDPRSTVVLQKARLGSAAGVPV